MNPQSLDKNNIMSEKMEMHNFILVHDDEVRLCSSLENQYIGGGVDIYENANIRFNENSITIEGNKRIYGLTFETLFLDEFEEDEPKPLPPFSKRYKWGIFSRLLGEPKKDYVRGWYLERMEHSKCRMNKYKVFWSN